MADVESSARGRDGGDASLTDAPGAGGPRTNAPGTGAPHAEGSSSDPATNIDPTDAADSEAEYEDEPEQGDEQHHGEDAKTSSGRGAWQGSRVTQEDIDWLIKSLRIPEGVACRLPGDEISPVPNQGE